MFKIENYILYKIGMTGLVASIAACTFTGGNALPSPESVNARWHRASLTEPFTINRYSLFKDRNFEALQGASCSTAESAVSTNNAGDTVYGIRVDDSIAIPPEYNSATVFLNGWRLVYQNSDHHVMALTTAIVNIENTGSELTWSAGGLLSDKNGDDAYTWCYHYTVLFWNDGVFTVSADVEDSDAEAAMTFLSGSSASDTSALQQELNISGRYASRPKALLPRGFGAMFVDGDDHHMLQFALKYGDLDVIAYEDGSGHDALWLFETVFKDKHTRHDYHAAQILSLMHGDSVEVINPEFVFEARDALNANIGPSGVFSDTVVIDDVPFDYAVPMLTGWDLASADSDRHIKDIGAWIENFEYTKAPGAERGILTYTIKGVFEDKGGIDITHTPRYQVSILGLNRSNLVTVPGGGFPATLENSESGNNLNQTTVNSGTVVHNLSQSAQSTSATSAAIISRPASSSVLRR